jgi:hypothetical protein
MRSVSIRCIVRVRRCIAAYSRISSFYQGKIHMKTLTIWLSVALTSTFLLGCAKQESALDKAVDSTKDALDIRDHEKLKDAAEDAHAAIKDAAGDAKEAAEEAAAGMKNAAAEAKDAAKDAAQAAKDAAADAKQAAKDSVDHR